MTGNLLIKNIIKELHNRPTIYKKKSESLQLLVGLLSHFWLDGVVKDELHEVVEGSVTLIGEDLVGVGLEELESRETTDLDLRVVDLVGSGIHLRDEDVVSVSELLSKLLVSGVKSLAVAAPGGVEEDEDVLGRIQGDLIEGLADDDVDGLVLLAGDGLGLEVGGELAFLVVHDELVELVLVELALELVLLHASVQALDHDDGGELAEADAEVVHQTGVLDGDVDEEGIALVSGGNLSEGVHVFLTFLAFLDEDDALGVDAGVGVEDLTGVLLVEGNDKGKLVLVGEAVDALDAELALELGELLVVLLVDDKGVLVEAEVLSDVDVDDVGEGEVVHGVGDGEVVLELLGLLGEDGDEDDVVGALELVEVGDLLDLLADGTGLTDDVLDDIPRDGGGAGRRTWRHDRCRSRRRTRRGRT